MASTSIEPAAKPEGGSATSCGGETTEAVNFVPDQCIVYGGLKKAKKERGCTAKERISKMPPCTAGKRSSIYRGVTRHRWTGRYEAHLWDKSTWNQNQNKKGKQVYLGAYDDEEAAARAYDLAALKYWGPGTVINFPVTDYTRDLEEMQNVSREDYLASLRRKSSGFSRGISKYRPLSRQVVFALTFTRLSSDRWSTLFLITKYFMGLMICFMPGADHFNSINYGAGDSSTSEHDYIAGFCIDRKIDLSNYIKWWGVNQSTKEMKGGCPEDIASELKAPEWSIQHTEPYEMPRLGVTIEKKEEKRLKYSALSILSSSEPFKSFQENALKLRRQEDNENDENENKNIISKTEHGKALENPALEGVTDRPGIAFGRGGGLTIQRNMFISNPLIAGSLPSSYNDVNPLTDPVLWTPLPPSLPLGSSRADEVTKNEPTSDYAFFQPEV